MNFAASNSGLLESSVDVVDLDSEIEDDPSLHGKDTPTSSLSSKNSPTKKNNRRKSKLLIRPSDDNISFETASVINTDDTNSVAKNKTATKKKIPKEPGSSVKLKNENLEQIMTENPNFESMQRVAFLRACVNYMLKVKKLPIIDFDSMETITLSKLLNTYHGITRTVSKDNDDIIGLSESDEDN